MRALIEKLIETESEAKRLVASAKTEAEGLLSKAQKEEAELLARTRTEARLEADKLVLAAKLAAERKKQELLARAAAEIDIQVRLDEMMKERAVAGAVRCVCGQQ